MNCGCRTPGECFHFSAEELKRLASAPRCIDCGGLMLEHFYFRCDECRFDAIMAQIPNANPDPTLACRAGSHVSCPRCSCECHSQKAG